MNISPDNLLKSSHNLLNSVEILNNLTSDKISLKIMQDYYHFFSERVLDFTVENKKIFDVCGTGGSGKIRFNTSTALAIKMSENHTIAKHANRASSGKIGSIDVLEFLNLPICRDEIQALEELNSRNLAFLLAPAFHPELVKLSAARREISSPTVFNFIMPLLNPVKNISGQMIGVSNFKMMEKMAEIANFAKKNVIFVHDLDNKLDDVSITGKTAIIEVLHGKITEYTVVPEDFDIPRVESFAEISGFTNAKANADLILQTLQGNSSVAYSNFLKINKIVAEGFFAKI